MAEIIAFPIVGRPVPPPAIGTAEHLDDVVAAMVENIGILETVHFLYLAAVRQQALYHKRNEERGYALDET